MSITWICVAMLTIFILSPIQRMPRARWLALYPYPFLLVSAGKKRNELHGWGEIRIMDCKDSRVYILVIVHYKVN